MCNIVLDTLNLICFNLDSSNPILNTSKMVKSDPKIIISLLFKNQSEPLINTELILLDPQLQIIGKFRSHQLSEL